ncbi:LysR family transcriptional regulator substrate-binding protein [Streptomyces paradoxus]|uniref:DNA-binding transcriptional LysR family regulator n=1 Tax=Streptomyces paradoxus TaxID=66375 RepID=A0A7W9WFF6_9ACTN|nr:DNA-binding transcriptional LysR family regulator [Streptomyces paradoxus]
MQPQPCRGEERLDDRFAGRATVTLPELADRPWVRCAMEPVVHGERFLDRAWPRGFHPAHAVFTEHTSTAVRMAAAGVGVRVAPAHLVRGAVGGGCVVLTPDPAWRRTLTVFSRLPPTGAAQRFVDLLRTAWPRPRAPRPAYEDCSEGGSAVA